jgi:hypothetical protein
MRYLGVQNVIDQPVYDTVRLAAVAGQTVQFFTVPLGGLLAAGIPKGYSHTNLLQQGRIEKGYKLTITALSLCVKVMADGAARVTWADYITCFNNGHFNFLFGDVSLLRLPSALLPPANSEIQYFSNIVAAATEYMPNHGIGSFTNKFELVSPLTLEEEETIRVDWFVGATPGAVTDVRLTLWGDMVTPVR